MVKIFLPDDELEFSFARSSGPGGQNVNKTNSKATLYWSIGSSKSIPEDIRTRFCNSFGNRINDEGVVVISSDETRDRMQNQARCKEKLLEMLAAVWTPPKLRKATKPTRSSQKKRVDTKRQRSVVKTGRGRVRDW